MYYKGTIYSSIGNRIVIDRGTHPRSETYLKIEKLSILNCSQLYNRLFRHGIHGFYKIDDSIDCVVIKGEILFYKDKKLLNSIVLENGSRPLRQGIVYDADHIIYNEYHGNKNRDPVHVYKYYFKKNRKEVLYAFNGIRHIHFIQKSIKEPDSLFIGTGDLDNECAIYKYDLSTRKMDKLGGGSQTWRAVSILEVKDKLVWGTDDPYNQNYLVKLNQSNGELETIQEIAGPAYYSTTTLNGDMYIGTTVEDRTMHRALIYHSVDGEHWTLFRQFKKDILHSKYFGYGVVDFIHNQKDLDELAYNLTGLY